MAKRTKRQPLIRINENTNTNTAVDPTEFRSVKREKLNQNNKNNNNSDPNPEPESEPEVDPAPVPKRARSARARNVEPEEQPVQGVAERRVLRSQYLALRNIITGTEQKEELSRGGSTRLQKFIEQTDYLYQHVQKPREQVADAETLLDIADTLLTTVRSYSKDGFTPSDFVSCLIREFSDGRRRMENDPVKIKWKDIGVVVSPILRKAHGCCTMVGPMNTEFKQRKVAAQRRRGRTTERTARPEQLEDTGAEEKTDTDKNMATMFDILRRKKSVRVENLILNRVSFAQSVENLFALSFLVKDGRAQITVDDKGTHLVSPRNAPPSNLVESGEVVYDHFVFRFDFKDWKFMLETVPQGDELMPHRYQVCIPLKQEDQVPVAIDASPIKKVSRNCGRQLNDETVTPVY